MTANTQSLQDKLAARGIEWAQIALPAALRAEDMWEFPDGWDRVPKEVLGLAEGQPGPDIFASTTPYEGFSANACAQAFLLRGGVELPTLLDGVHDQLPPDSTTQTFESRQIKATPTGVTTRMVSVYSASPQGEPLICTAESLYDLAPLGDGERYLLVQRTVTARVDDPAPLPTFKDVMQDA